MAIKQRKQTKIEVRLAKLEREVALLLRQISKQQPAQVREVTPVSVAYRPLTNKEIRKELMERGVIRPPSPEEIALAAKWKSRPKKEREQIIAKLGRLKIDPPLSEIIHQMRS